MREGVINEYAIKFVVPVPAQVHKLHFTWENLAGRPVSFTESLASLRNSSVDVNPPDGKGALKARATLRAYENRETVMGKREATSAFRTLPAAVSSAYFAPRLRFFDRHGVLDQSHPGRRNDEFAR